VSTFIREVPTARARFIGVKFMSTIKEIFIGIIAGLIIGLPQGMRDLPKMVSNDLPQDTILLITCLGGIGGLLLGMKFLSRGDPKEYSLIGYFSFLIGSLSIGIPTVIRHFNGNLMKDFTKNLRLWLGRGKPRPFYGR